MFGSFRCFDESLASNSKRQTKCVPLNNRLCQASQILFSINSNEKLYYPFTVSINKCGGSCNTIDDLYTRVCIPNQLKL